MRFAFRVGCCHICFVHPGSSSQRKLVYAAVVSLLTFGIMAAWGIFIRPYTDGFSDWLAVRLGNGLSFIAVLAVAGLLLAYGLWPRADDPPPVAIRKPLWFKIIGAFFFWLPIAGLLFVGIALGLAYLT